MLGLVGAALLQSSRATSAVERILRGLSIAYGRKDVRSFVLPTLVMIEDPREQNERTSIFPATGPALRLDQADSVEQLTLRALAERPSPSEVATELNQIRATRPRFGVLARILGHAVLTVGFGLVLDPVAIAIPVYLVLGLIVGATTVLGSRVRTLALLLPTLTAFALTLLTAWFVAPIVGDDPIRLVAPALVSFLPGLTVTLAAVELTSNQVVAGASRMVYGAAQFGLLVFGVYAALALLGTHPSTQSPPQLGMWAPWLGILLTAIGFNLFSVAPRRALPWIVLSLTVAYGAQLLAGFFIGAALAGFVGAVAIIVVVGLLRRITSSPPSAVMLTCAYWLLVPGGLGFIGLTTAAEQTPGGSSLVLNCLTSLLAIAIGMVVGVGFTQDSSAVGEPGPGRHGSSRIARVRRRRVRGRPRRCRPGARDD
ncbi:threonine/serine ThrE exporter family protein [Leifsonia flava]|nr:threonine/serine exporter family protein [Leifsonia flava]